MSRRSTIVLATLLVLGSLAATPGDAQSPSELMKKGTDFKSLAEPLDLNSASLDQLKKLPGLGDADAKKIVAGRPFTKTSDLVDKKILSSSVYENVKGLLTVK
jgi:competence protein ComEA